MTLTKTKTMQLKIAKTTLPARPLTFEAWQRHIQVELFATQQKNLKYKIADLITGGVTLKTEQR